MVLISYTIVGLIAKRFCRGHQQFEWKIVWKSSSLILALPVFVILSFIEKPPMPPPTISLDSASSF